VGSEGLSPSAAVVRALNVPMTGHPSGALGRASADVLSGVPLFAGLTKRQLRAVGDRAKIVRFSAGHRVIAEGTDGDAFYVVLEGVARVVRSTSGRAIKRVGPGGFFGELAMIDGRPRSANVIGVSPLVLLRLTRSAFLQVIRKQPDIALRVMEVLASRLRDAEGAPTAHL
jgi:CRP/FNR family cyclic AMP-dependent transcriptional regulator